MVDHLTDDVLIDAELLVSEDGSGTAIATLGDELVYMIDTELRPAEGAGARCFGPSCSPRAITPR